MMPKLMFKMWFINQLYIKLGLAPWTVGVQTLSDLPITRPRDLPKKLSHTFLHNLLSWYGALHAKVLNFASTPAAGAPSGTQLG